MPTPPKPSYKDFKLHSRFGRINPSYRLAFLIGQARGEMSIDFRRLQQMREGFDRFKFKVFPISDTTICYCCDSPARIRHHVIPLSKGGRNKSNNIVPLCDLCHIKIHPEMATRGRKKKGAIQPIPNALCAPRVTIVVIPPKR